MGEIRGDDQWTRTAWEKQRDLFTPPKKTKEAEKKEVPESEWKAGPPQNGRKNVPQRTTRAPYRVKNKKQCSLVGKRIGKKKKAPAGLRPRRAKEVSKKKKRGSPTVFSTTKMHK